MEYRWNKNWAAKYIAGLTDKKILVVNDLQLARKLAVSNSVTYLTDDEKSYHTFLKMVSPLNNVNFGMDDSVHLVDYKADFTKDIAGMKFDLIVGNPPYDRSLHLKILEHLLEFAKEIVWISPVRWLQDPLAKYKKTSDLLKYKNTILTKLKEVEVVIAKDAVKLFDNYDFDNDLAIYHLDAESTEVFDTRKLYHNVWFLDKVVERTVNEIDSVYDYWLDKNSLDLTIPFVRMTALIGSRTHKYKLFPKQHDTAFAKNAKKVGGLNFDTQEEAENFFNYMQTDFIKFLGITIKRDVHVPLTFIPYMNDYTRPWTDKDLFELFNITEEEQKIIHDTVKEIAKW